jgi:hypothetical protein
VVSTPGRTHLKLPIFPQIEKRFLMATFKLRFDLRKSAKRNSIWARNAIQFLRIVDEMAGYKNASHYYVAIALGSLQSSFWHTD